MERTDKRELSNETRTGSIPVCEIRSVLSVHRDPKIVLNRKQNNVWDGTEFFFDEDMGLLTI